MPITLRASTCRRILLGFVLAGGISSFVVLVVIGRDGAISEFTATAVSEKLLETYVPLLGLMGGFFLSEFGQTSIAQHGRIRTDTFTYAAVLIFLWSLLPPLFLAIFETAESAMRMLDTFGLFGTTICVAALAFTFSKGAQTRAK